MSDDHAHKMNQTYRRMRHVYDLSRPALLPGRHAARQAVIARAPATVAEIGAGTGRNITLLARALPKAQFLGVEIADVMLDTARRKTARYQNRVHLVQADAARFELPPQDVILFSYALSMIPDWQSALRRAAASTRTIVIVDFGAAGGWPAPLARQLRRNLAAFHVSPRTGLDAFLAAEPAFSDAQLRSSSWLGGYAELRVLSLSAP